jgi:hypothetical protein
VTYLSAETTGALDSRQWFRESRRVSSERLAEIDLDFTKALAADTALSAAFAAPATATGAFDQMQRKTPGCVVMRIPEPLPGG